MKTENHNHSMGIKPAGYVGYCLVLLSLLTPPGIQGAVRYVDINSSTPAAPYTSWATAATNIQDAIDAASAGDQILVTNGVYQTGGRVVHIALTNRVAVTKAVSVQSVNGPAVTIIRGYQVPGTTNGVGAVRCAYLTNGASLAGFSLINGATMGIYNPLSESGGGGVWCEAGDVTVSNCTLSGNSASREGGGAYSGTLDNCTVTNNRADWGGGAYASTLNYCAVSANSASSAGGGAAWSMLNNCTLNGNSAGDGGGVLGGTLNNCALTGNSAALGPGGGAHSGTLNNCTLIGNSALGSGGGAYYGTLNNCALIGNSALESGGGANFGTLNNCTLAGNSALSSGGGAYDCVLTNCIVYYNTTASQADANYNSGSSFNYCCTTPPPPDGTGNLAAEPQLASGWYIAETSPCRGAGHALSVIGTDIDGEAWADPPSVGCDEFYSASATGALSVAILANHTNVAIGFPVELQGLIAGHASDSRWEFGDGTVVSNRPYASHAWVSAGDYAVILRAYNQDYPVGVSATATVHVVTQPVHYVRQSGSVPTAPYNSWATAAARIQDAVDAASTAGALVLVTNGVYASGGRVVFGALTNRVAVIKQLTVQSVNGPAVTSIRGFKVPGTISGDTAVRCVYLTSGAVLSGFTLTNGSTRAQGDALREGSGGGVWCESAGAVLTNCILRSNSAQAYGGGAQGGTLVNCTLIVNSAQNGIGGGANQATLSQCTLSGNSTPGLGGGAASSFLRDCILSGNTGGLGGGASGSTLTNCTLSGNSASDGGAVSYCTLYNCAISANSAAGSGGGASEAILNHCTLSGNSAGESGGGAYGGTLSNSIVYYNTTTTGEDANYNGGCSLNYSCTTPLPPAGTGNITTEPQLASASHLSAISPCRGAGSVLGTSGTDIDGEPWANPPSIGCDEYNTGSVTGALSVAVVANYTNVVATGFPIAFQGFVSGRVSASRWEFGDGTVISNRPSLSHIWGTAGDYTVILRAYNEDYPAGVTGSVTVHIVTQPVHYVRVSGSTPAAPYTSWATAANRIQNAVDAASVPGALVLVSNGVYAVGGVVVSGDRTNRVAVTKLLTVQSVNGPAVTTIRGYQVPGTTNGNAAIRCVYLASGAMLSGFTLTNGATGTGGPDDSGGGVWCESFSAMVSNCVITGNSAYWSGGGAQGGTIQNSTLSGNAGSGASSSVLNDCTLSGNAGGGAVSSRLNNCILSSNVASYAGGGASYCTLVNCMLSSNSVASYGGGTYDCTLTDCTLTGNFAGTGGGAFWGTLTRCTLTGNVAYSAGGAHNATLNNCLLVGNSALSYGGGAEAGTLNNCILTGNSAQTHGGGARDSTLNNCALSGNSAGETGGGASRSALNNCTLSGNSAIQAGGGSHDGTLNNCIVYYNSTASKADDNYNGGASLNYCCTTPLPPTGAGNITAEPQLASGSHVAANSPCRGAGSIGNASGTDIDGELWANPPSIGCDEFYTGSATGALSVAILANYTNVATGFDVDFQSFISGRVSASRWEFGDGTVVSNRPLATHAWLAAGDYVVTLRAYNQDYPAGATASITIHIATQPVHYVSLVSAAPSPPYTSWATAATNIQDAVDAASVVGALVLVSNGVYATGGRLAAEDTTNRVAITKVVTVQSVNGPMVTIIRGYQPPGDIFGDAAIRCVYLSNDAVLSGFTLTNGSTRIWGNGGGLWCATPGGTATNCIIVGNTADRDGGGAHSVRLNNCIIRSNSAPWGGGGVASCSLNDCTLTGNSARNGGGAFYSTLDRCILSGNWANRSGNSWENGGAGAYGGTLNHCTVQTNTTAGSGGGANQATLNHCTLTGNTAGAGGGAESCTLNNCTLAGNSAFTYFGGGAASGTLNNCTVTGNRAPSGGGVVFATLNNCTVTGNSALASGGGAQGCALKNCIVYYNSTTSGAEANFSGGSLSNCCTTPLPSTGAGNISTDPQLASTSHLSAASPCRGAGSALYATGADIDGEPWATPPSIGCDEYYTGSITGALSVAILPAYTNALTGFSVDFQALISGQVSASRWEFGDGTILSNQPFASHAWLAVGNYPVVLRAYNQDFPAGVTASVVVQVVPQPVYYVSLASVTPTAPYSSWATAATNIQDAVDAASVAGALVLVTNGVYETGGRVVSGDLTNRVAVTKPLILQSVNGPDATVILGDPMRGDTAVRCVYLSSGAVLSGFTLTNGATRTIGAEAETGGGGVWCESPSAVVSNCVLVGNSATRGGAAAGSGNPPYAGPSGPLGGTLLDCLITANSADSGGGASSCTLNRCTLSGNSAWGPGGGVDGCSLNYCTLNENQTYYAGGGAWEGTLNDCLIVSNIVWSGWGFGGGGVSAATLTNCVLLGNSADVGGGADGGTLVNCTLVGNSAWNAAGGYYEDGSGLVANCIVYYNDAPSGPNYWSGNFSYSCTTPLPSGAGNISDDPLLVNLAGGDLRLQSNSPAINAGANAFVSSVGDLDGLPRIVGGLVDMGAYEFQGPGLDEFIAWLLLYGLPTDGSVDFADTDGDGHNNWQEWRAGTDPTNAASGLRLFAPTSNGMTWVVQWSSVSNKTYALEKSTNSGLPSFFLLASGIWANTNITTFLDTNPPTSSRCLYRILLQE